MQVDEWGQKLWSPIHCISFNQTDILEADQKVIIENFFTNLKDVLPCKYCRQSYQEYIKILPISLYSDTVHGCAFWLYIIHAFVNKKLNKPNASFKDVCSYYLNKKAKCTKEIDKTGHEYSTCKIKERDVFDEEVNEFVKITFHKYGKITYHILKQNNWPLDELTKIES
jgi:hypothetical protein